MKALGQHGLPVPQVGLRCAPSSYPSFHACGELGQLGTGDGEACDVRRLCRQAGMALEQPPQGMLCASSRAASAASNTSLRMLFRSIACPPFLGCPMPRSRGMRDAQLSISDGENPYTFASPVPPTPLLPQAIDHNRHAVLMTMLDAYPLVQARAGVTERLPVIHGLPACRVFIARVLSPMPCWPLLAAGAAAQLPAHHLRSTHGAAVAPGGAGPGALRL